MLIEFYENVVLKNPKSLITILNGNHIDIAENLKIGIKNSLCGFTNLYNSYKNDSVVSSKLNLIIKQLNSILSILDKFSNPNEETLQEIENYTQ